jgi:gamma-glutamyltranspeptidase
MHRPGVIALAVALGAAPLAPLPAQQGADVAGLEAAVVADHPLAAAAGADVLRRGGNAVDAAITMAALLGVVRPHMGGIGGDAVMLYRDAASGRVHALNGTGRAGELATPEAFRQRGFDAVPVDGALAVMVPGALRLWADALRRFGTIGLASALAPAIHYAERGFPVSSTFASEIEHERDRLAGDAALRARFLPNGIVPAVGSLLRQPELAESLRLIARDGPDVFYVGEIARRIAAYAADIDALLRIEDLAGHSTIWQEPAATSYLGYRVHAMPPSTQGVALLLQMNMAETIALRPMGHNSADYMHVLLRIRDLALHDRDRYVADPAFVDVPTDRLLSKEYARRRAAGLLAHETSARERAGNRAPGGGGASVLTVVDGDGNAAILVQGLHRRFGSALMVPGTGIILNSRAAAFELEAGHPNVIAPGKRPLHTLSPALAARPDGSALVLFGSPGADPQTATLLQVFHNVVLFGMAPQRAVEAPRFHAAENGVLLVEEALPDPMWQAFAALGYSIRRQPQFTAEMGSAQIILVLPSGVRMIGADPRREAFGIAW